MREIFVTSKLTFGITIFIILSIETFAQEYKIVDTKQDKCYDTINQIAPPSPNDPYYGQDAQHNGNQPSYQDHGDGTVTDHVTGLMWQKYLYPVKLSYYEALSGADTCTVGGYNDWRLPSIKELYSLILFNGYTATTAGASVPFIDTGYFDFRYGNETAGERFIDAQYASTTTYVGTTMNGNFTMFGVNFADGRIKGYGTDPLPGQTEYKLFEVRFVRGNPGYGVNEFTDNGDGTISDSATALMWTKGDNGMGLLWEEALAWGQQKNSENYLGYNDWRLPNAKELQSIVDYSRSPQTSNSAAINQLFETTSIIDEGGGINYPFYWTSTTHADGPPDIQYSKAAYLCFGEALGFMEFPPQSGNYTLMDVHGAGAQRSDLKSGDPGNWPNGNGPQGDVVRIFNYVRLVRDVIDASGIIDTQNNPDWLKIYPNPFPTSTTIEYILTIPGNVSISIFNQLNQIVEIIDHGNFQTGKHQIVWDASGLPNGIYFIHVRAGQEVAIRKIIKLG